MGRGSGRKSRVGKGGGGDAVVRSAGGDDAMARSASGGMGNAFGSTCACACARVRGSEESFFRKVRAVAAPCVPNKSAFFKKISRLLVF